MGDITFDIFNTDGFSAATLTRMVNESVPFIPGFLGALGDFTAEGVYSTSVDFDELKGQVSLIATSPRGSAPSQSANVKGTIRTLKTVRLAREAVLLADQIQNIRMLGTASELMTAQRLLFNRIEGPSGLKAALSLTLEHMYLGAVDGQVLDADGVTVLYDCFAFYGVGRQPAVNVQFSTSTSDGSTFMTALNAARRTAVKALNGLSLAQAMPIVLCGDNYYDAAWGCKEAVAARKIGATGNSDAIDIISGNKAYSSFVYNKTTFVNYRGSDDGTVGVPTNEGRYFMHGVPGLFRTFFAPADTWDLANTEGLPSYLIQRRERQTESARAFELQSNPLVMCMRPLSLMHMTMS